MNADNYGFVIQPKKYLMWNAELIGNTDDTGGIYVFLFFQIIKPIPSAFGTPILMVFCSS